MQTTTAIGSWLIAACCLPCVAGCSILDAYYTPSEHFQFATVAKGETKHPVDRTVEIVREVLIDREITIQNVEQTEETAQIRGVCDGRQYVIDVTKCGEGSSFRLEIDQVGNDGIAYGIVRQILAFP